jgi:hypothetical protein
MLPRRPDFGGSEIVKHFDQHVEHLRLKRAGKIHPWVFFRMVAKGHGGEQHPKPIKSFGKAWKRACLAAWSLARFSHAL